MEKERKKRILLVDPSDTFLHRILDHPQCQIYAIATAHDGAECIKKSYEFQPDLILVELMLPIMHGIEVLKAIKGSDESRAIGVILTSAQSMYQNYQAALECGADYFLEKPFLPEDFFEVARSFFEGTLKPKPFGNQLNRPIYSSTCYIPSTYTRDEYIRFWGTRGSNAVAGADYIRFGGNTCCLEVRYGKDLVIIDAGSGIRPLGNSLAQEKIETIHLFIGHTHWDHITGFPFFAPLYEKDVTIIIHAPIGFEKNTQELFNEMLAYSFFPVRLDEMQSRLIFKELRAEKPVQVGNLLVNAHYTYHPGPTFGFKITTPRRSFGYVTDNEVLYGFQGHPNEIDSQHPLLEPHLGLIKFLKGSDFLIHEAQYLPIEYHEKIGWGHSSVPNATVLLKHTEIPEWIVTHHDPMHSDQILENKLRLHQDVLLDCGMHSHVSFAFDGLIVPL